MKRSLCVFVALVSILLIILCGCGSENSKSELKVEGAEFISGNWHAEAVYKDNIIYWNKVISFKDIPDLAELYDFPLSFHDDGTFNYKNMYPLGGSYKLMSPNANNEKCFLLNYETQVRLEDGKLIEEEYTGNMCMIVTVLDQNTIRFNEFDPLIGNEKADGMPLIFVRDGHESEFIEINKLNFG